MINNNLEPARSDVFGVEKETLKSWVPKSRRGERKASVGWVSPWPSLPAHLGVSVSPSVQSCYSWSPCGINKSSLKNPGKSPLVRKSEMNGYVERSAFPWSLFPQKKHLLRELSVKCTGLRGSKGVEIPHNLGFCFTSGKMISVPPRNVRDDFI